MSRTVKPYGLWTSPVTAAVVARGVSLSDVRWAAPEGGPLRLVWLERRAGKGVLVATDGGHAPFEVTADFNVKAKLGYGGGDFSTFGDDVFFVADGRIYRQPIAGGDARPITPPFGQAASPTPSPDGRFVAFVHSAERRDCVAVVDAAGRLWPQKILQGDDFYMQPAWHPSGRMLAAIAWNHPHMPWDSTELRLVRLRFWDGDDPVPPVAAETTVVAGGPSESVQQPVFSPDGRYLAYVSDRSGYWHLYLYDLETGRHTQLTEGPYEHGQPPWVQGIRTYGFAPDGQSIFYLRSDAGFCSLWQCVLEDEEGRLVPRHRRVEGVFDEYPDLSQIAVAPAMDEAGRVAVACIASAPSIPPRIVAGRLAPDKEAEGPAPPTVLRGPAALIVRRSQWENFEPGALAQPRPVQWTSAGGATVYGLYYAPTNPHFTAEGLPPAVISVHGGPTSQAVPEFNPRVQWFATRGYAVLEVNYRGSTGYGRVYREQLKGRWGIVDVEDAVSGAEFLVREGLADRGRLVIMGGSAGGYTVLRALITHPGFFKAGLCLYGVADLFALASDTHKLEERYTDSLVGPLPEAAALYRELSPVFHARRIKDPVAIFQGTDDPVVTKAQADALVAALKESGAPYEYHVYEGEGHGWSKPETIEKFYAAVDAFLRKYVVFA